ncbi:hypothetical protein E7Z59_14045 [Robertkochia marina]|uniref:Tetratricopeptide repeat protein n=1 Tax=Robertkochia marina TaxID=1227945 RepID=A0A4S3LY53_9FLAO|nr:hypothetical protein [Robertkochia marina]THD65707.1 hypothetical protein E7Z59_14045 [Robertkochia marina]TRZ46609.1 hypothetical protein D3A96_03305 [Robertkochia marina]
MKRIITVLILIFCLSCQTTEKKEQDQLGVVHLEVSGNEKAREHFKKGLLLLHSFEYTDAREAFHKAISADPDMGMAYWGEAMTYNHSIWFEQDFEKAVESLEKMGSREHLKLDDPLEQDLVAGVKILYQPEKSKAQRDQEYAGYLKALYQKYPGNHEVASFYALSLLGTVSEGRDYEVYGEAARIAREVLNENPKHPGALHYLIHSYDDPDHAHLALNAADAYAKVAPDASHALHMPSHIYVAKGMWEQVVASNEESYQASLNRMERKSLSNDARGYHSYHWLQYGYLQQGRTDLAKEMTINLSDYVAATPSKRGRSHMVFLKGTYLVETNDWTDAIGNIPVEVADLNITIRAQYMFIEGLKASMEKDLEALLEIIQNMETDLSREAVLVDNLEKGYPGCTNLTRETANQTDLQFTQAMIFQLKAYKAILENDPELTERFLKEAVAIEERLSYSYGPPVIQKPTLEMYADWLLTQGRASEALKTYQKALQRTPNRTLTLEGALKAAEMADKPALVKQFKEQLSNNMKYPQKA